MHTSWRELLLIVLHSLGACSEPADLCRLPGPWQRWSSLTQDVEYPRSHKFLGSYELKQFCQAFYQTRWRRLPLGCSMIASKQKRWSVVVVQTPGESMRKQYAKMQIWCPWSPWGELGCPLTSDPNSKCPVRAVRNRTCLLLNCKAELHGEVKLCDADCLSNSLNPASSSQPDMLKIIISPVVALVMVGIVFYCYRKAHKTLARGEEEEATRHELAREGQITSDWHRTPCSRRVQDRNTNRSIHGHGQSNATCPATDDQEASPPRTDVSVTVSPNQGTAFFNETRLPAYEEVVGQTDDSSHSPPPPYSEVVQNNNVSLT